jgi:hypothetical protein
MTYVLLCHRKSSRWRLGDVERHVAIVRPGLVVQAGAALRAAVCEPSVVLVVQDPLAVAAWGRYVLVGADEVG